MQKKVDVKNRKRNRRAHKHGVITIFLCLILAPVLIFCEVIVDGSRYYSAKNVVSNVGDLTLYTALSDFNVPLKDAYGLFAMQDTPQSMQDSLKLYIQDMLEKNTAVRFGGAGTSLQSTIENLCNWATGSSPQDYQNSIGVFFADSANGGSFETYGVDNATLGNYNILESQIVEYMKYRGPAILLVDGLLSKLMSFEEVSKEADVVLAETKYQEQYAELGDYVIMTYLYIKAFLDESKKYLGIASGDELTLGFLEKKLRESMDSISYNAELIRELSILYNACMLHSLPENHEDCLKNINDVVNEYGTTIGVPISVGVSEVLNRKWDQSQKDPGWSKVKEIALSRALSYSNPSASNLVDYNIYIEPETESDDDNQGGGEPDNSEITSDSLSTGSGLTESDKYFMILNSIDKQITDRFHKPSDLEKNNQGRVFNNYTTVYGIIRDKIFKGEPFSVKQIINDHDLSGGFDNYDLWSEVDFYLHFMNAYKNTINGNEYGYLFTLISIYNEVYDLYNSSDPSGAAIFKKNSDVYHSYIDSIYEARTDICLLSAMSLWEQNDIEKNINYRIENLNKEAEVFANIANMENLLTGAVSFMSSLDDQIDQLDKLRNTWEEKNKEVSDEEYRASMQQKIDKTKDINITAAGDLANDLNEFLAVLKEYRELYESVEITTFSNKPIQDAGKYIKIYSEDSEDIVQAMRWTCTKDKSNAKKNDYWRSNEDGIWPDEAVHSTVIPDLPSSASKQAVPLVYRVGELKWDVLSNRDVPSLVNNYIKEVNQLDPSELTPLRDYLINGGIVNKAVSTTCYISPRVSKSLSPLPQNAKLLNIEDTIKENDFYKQLVTWTKDYETKVNDTTAQNEASSSESSLDDTANNSKIDGTISGIDTDVFKASSGDISSLLTRLDAAASGLDDDTFSMTETGNASEKNKSGFKDFFEKIGDCFKSAKDTIVDIAKLPAELLSDPEGFFERQRDNIYITTYMMENFSCATTNKNPDNGTDLQNNLERSISGYTFDEYNNFFYRAEIEYILYGGESPADSLSTSKGAVYGLRFGLNTIYAFSAYDIQGLTHKAASAITFAFPFLEPLVNVILTLVLAGAESAIDLNQLMDGKSVVIYKTKDTWVLSLTGAVNAAKDVAIKVANNVVNAAFDALTQAIENGSQGIENYLNDYIDQASNDVQNTVINEILNPAMNTIVSTVNSTGFVSMSKDEMKTSYKTAVSNYLRDVVNSNQNKDGLFDKAKLVVIQNMQNGGLDSIYSAVDGLIDKYYATPTQIISNIQTTIDKEIENTATSLAGYAKNAISKFRSSAVSSMVSGLNSLKDQSSSKVTSFINDKFSNLSSTVTANGGGTPISTAKQEGKLLTLTYKEYLTIFMLLKMQSDDKRQDMEKRMAVLINFNMNKYSTDEKDNRKKQEKYNDNQHVEMTKLSGFNIYEAYTMIGIHGKFGIKTFFLGGDDLSLESIGKNEAYIDYQSVLGY